MKLRLFALFAALLMALLSGCANQPKKMLAEDIESLTVYAPEIAVLKNRKLGPNTREKYDAAKRLAEGVDFSLTRSLETVESYFSPSDAIYSNNVEFGQEVAFYYHYQNSYVRFRFWHTKHAVTDVEVRIK